MHPAGTSNSSYSKQNLFLLSLPSLPQEKPLTYLAQFELQLQKQVTHVRNPGFFSAPNPVHFAKS
jgi:hypothetical protein